MQALKLLYCQPLRGSFISFLHSRTKFITFSSSSSSHTNAKNNGEDEWNDAWEMSWLPEDVAVAKNRAPWETDVNFSNDSTVVLPLDADNDTKAFIQDMNDNWNERRGVSVSKKQVNVNAGDGNLVEKMKTDYRLKKQRIHAGLWMKEIDKEEEAKFGNFNGTAADSHSTADIDKLLDTCSEIFDSGNSEFHDLKVPSTSEFKTKPDGWETTSKSQDGNIWEMTQREEDILLQEFERRIAFSKFQIASFIKTHIFSRRRPIDGWKYMIEELGPNAKKGKGGVARLPSLSDPATQPFREEKALPGNRITPYRERH